MSAEIEYAIEHNPSYAQLKLSLASNQTVMVEAGAMSAMDSSIKMKSKAKGGLMGGIGRMLGGESLFISEFTAQGKGGDLYVSPGVPGDIQHYYLSGHNGLMVQSSGFVAAGPDVTMDTKFQGLKKGFFSGESFFLIKVTGTGDFWFSSFGAILEIPIDGGYVVDTGYIVAFEDTLSYDVEVINGLSFKNLKTAIFGGEGFVARFSGKGRLWIQSRNLYPFINFLHPFRPVKSSD
ncbi:MAG: TIGR00266 family protein [Merismopedia sp. SIO2A8]|nr:TIGR00266 family protein [Merismopedia sp. SIO2A8]